MDATIVGSQIVLLCGDYCSSVYLGRIKHFTGTKKTDYEILITNSSLVRSDVGIWINAIKLGSWQVAGKSSIRIKNYPFSMDQLIFDDNTTVTVTFFSSADNISDPDKPIPLTSVVDVETFTLNIVAEDRVFRNYNELVDKDVILY